MEKFILKPDLTVYPGVTVTKDTELSFETENVKQTLKDLVFRCVTTVKDERYQSTYDTSVYLKEGDVVIYDGDDRGYVVPAMPFAHPDEVVSDLNVLKEME